MQSGPEIPCGCPLLPQDVLGKGFLLKILLWMSLLGLLLMLILVLDGILVPLLSFGQYDTGVVGIHILAVASVFLN